MLSAERRSEILLTNISKDDCGVIAFQAVTGRPREEAMEIMLASGYEPGKGTDSNGVELALKQLGYKVEPVPAPEVLDTAATFALAHEYGTYVVHVVGRRGQKTYGHVMALLDGDLHNARGFFGDPVVGVSKVTAP